MLIKPRGKSFVFLKDFQCYFWHQQQLWCFTELSLWLLCFKTASKVSGEQEERGWSNSYKHYLPAWIILIDKYIALPTDRQVIRYKLDQCLYQRKWMISTLLKLEGVHVSCLIPFLMIRVGMSACSARKVLCYYVMHLLPGFASTWTCIVTLQMEYYIPPKLGRWASIFCTYSHISLHLLWFLQYDNNPILQCHAP